MGTGKENKIQAAIAGSLQVYCQHRNLQLFPPYSNQQGSSLHKYCGDLFGLLDNADLIALEIKELDVKSGRLFAFDPVQHEEAKRFEKLRIPLAYAYNTVEVLPYHEYPQPGDWAAGTLNSIKRSLPTPLPNEIPNQGGHKTLLQWLNGKHRSDACTRLGKLHGALRTVDELRNGFLVLLYSVPQRKLATLSKDNVLDLVAELHKNRSSLPEQALEKLDRLLGESAEVFKMFSNPNTSGTKPPGGSYGM